MDPVPPATQSPEANEPTEKNETSVSSAGETVSSIRESVTAVSRYMHQPRTYERLRKMAGTDLDKVSEIILHCLVGSNESELRLSDLADRLGVELSSVSRKVHKLLEQGLVTRTTDPNDARAWRLHLTDQGREELRKITEMRVELLAVALQSWSDNDRTKLAELLARFTTDVLNQPGATE